MHENPILKHDFSSKIFVPKIFVFANPIIKHNNGSKILF